MAKQQTAACYIRVSTDDQTEYSPSAQLSAIKRYCENNNLYLNPEYIFSDEGKSGRTAEARPEFMRMIGTAKKKPVPFDVILVHKFDRFARNREDSIVYKSLLSKECGVKVISITETIENDKMSIIMESMLEAMAEYYSINLSEEVKKGMTEKAKRGEPLSIPPYGYFMKDKQLIINEEEAKIIRKIFEDFTNGKPYLRISKELNAMGLKTHRGNPFENRTIEYILRNPVYAGYIRWNPTERTRRNYNHPDIMVNKGQHIPIVTEEEFIMAQNRVKEIKSMHPTHSRTKSNPSHWLVGLVKCPYCGNSYCNANGYMVCGGIVRGSCLSERVSVKTEILAEMVIDAVADDIKSKNTPFSVLKVDSPSIDSSYGNILMELEIKKDRLQRAYLAYEKGIDTIEEYGENKKRLQAEISELESKLPAKKEISAADYQQQFNHILQDMYDALTNDGLSNAEKHDAAKMLIRVINVTKPPLALKIQYQYTAK